MAEKISTILDKIDEGSISLPVFQRGYVWNRRQVRDLFTSLYKQYPVGSLLVWETKSPDVQTRGDLDAPTSPRQILLDGQQRITSLYGVMRGQEPAFFDGSTHAFKSLRFHLEEEVFEFHQPIKMRKDPLWIDLTTLYQKGWESFNIIHKSLAEVGLEANYGDRIGKLLGIRDRAIHVDFVDASMTVDEVVEIFDRVNSGGTKLTQGDLALAKICADWPEARETMQSKLSEWQEMNYDFTLDWLLRVINAVVTNKSKFANLHDKNKDEIQNGLQRSEKYADVILNLIGSRLGLDHNQVLFAKGIIPVMVAFLDLNKGDITANQRDKLLYWYSHNGMWGRYSGPTETRLDLDLSLIQNKSPNEAIDSLINELRRWRGGLNVEPQHFQASTRGHRFYSVLYMITRMGQTKDLLSGLPLKEHLLRNGSHLALHHIFPKGLLYNAKYDKGQRNSLANFCFLTPESNHEIGYRAPVDYLKEIDETRPEVLESQWIPTDPALWHIEKYPDFLETRRELLAKAANKILDNLLLDKEDKSEDIDSSEFVKRSIESTQRPASIADDKEEKLLLDLNEWMKEQELPIGLLGYEIADPETGEEIAMFDLAWPDGVQSELSEPVAVLIDEDVEVLAAAGRNGYRFFTSPDDFKQYINNEILMASNGNGIREIIEKGESGTVEFKSSLRMNKYTNEKDGRLEHSVLKTLAGFLNRDGGTLLIGVADDGSPLGIEADKFKSEDSMSLHLTNLVKSRMDPIAMTEIRIDYGTYQDYRIMKVVSNPSPIPIFVKDGAVKRFYVRMGPSTDELPADKIHEYIKHRFNQ